MNRPVIGITPLVDEQRESFWMLPGYMNGITEAGGLPVMLPLTDDPEQIRQIAGFCSAFLLTGGQDVSPSLFLQLVGEKGGLAAAKQLISKPGGTEGFTTLWEYHRLDLSVEALVLRPEYKSLFLKMSRSCAKIG